MEICWWISFILGLCIQWVGLILMRKISHIVIAGSSGSAVGLAIFGSGINWLIFSFTCIASSMLPDRLEYIFKNVRWVRHRTLTHWLGGWLALLVGWLWVCKEYGVGGFLESGIAGLLVGGCVHLICDMTTPMGVPIFLPLSKGRVSFGLVRTGFSELIAVLFSTVASYLWIQNYFGF